MSGQNYLGFEAFKRYVASCDVVSYKNDEVHRNDDGSCIWFRDASKSRAQSDMEYVLNVTKFHHFFNLMPVETEPSVAFCQLMAFECRAKLNLTGESGTYLIRFRVWSKVVAHKDEAQWSQQVTYDLSTDNKDYTRVIICL